MMMVMMMMMTMMMMMMMILKIEGEITMSGSCILYVSIRE